MPRIRKSHWEVNYFWSKGSGLRLGTCNYRGTKAIHTASVPFVYVNYWGDSSGPFTDMLQSTSNAVEVREIMFGFDLKVTYDIYGADYQYDHVWRFLEDGQFNSTIIVQGPGEEVDGRHTYHVPFRIDLDVSGSGGDSFQRRGSAGWGRRRARRALRPDLAAGLGLARPRPRKRTERLSAGAAGRQRGALGLALPPLRGLGILGGGRKRRAWIARQCAGHLRGRGACPADERRSLVHRTHRFGSDSRSLRTCISPRRLRRTGSSGAARARRGASSGRDGDARRPSTRRVAALDGQARSWRPFRPGATVQ